MKKKTKKSANKRFLKVTNSIKKIVLIAFVTYVLVVLYHLSNSTFGDVGSYLREYLLSGIPGLVMGGLFGSILSLIRNPKKRHLIVDVLISLVETLFITGFILYVVWCFTGIFSFPVPTTTSIQLTEELEDASFTLTLGSGFWSSSEYFSNVEELEAWLNSEYLKDVFGKKGLFTPSCGELTITTEETGVTPKVVVEKLCYEYFEGPIFGTSRITQQYDISMDSVLSEPTYKKQSKSLNIHHLSLFLGFLASYLNYYLIRELRKK